RRAVPVPRARPAGAPPDPVRQAIDLHAGSARGRQRQGAPRGRARRGLQSDPDRGPVSPRDRERRNARGVRRRSRRQAQPAGAGAGRGPFGGMAQARPALIAAALLLVPCDLGGAPVSASAAPASAAPGSTASASAARTAEPPPLAS